mgnify:CR=1 FL=1
MSKESLDQFIQQISDNEELQSLIGYEMEADPFIALGAEHGYEFTVEDLTGNVELSEEELDGVAGGAKYVKFPGIGIGLSVGPVSHRN